MSQNDVEKNLPDSSRREFIKGASAGGLLLLMGGVPLIAQEATNTASKDTHFSTEAAPVSCALIGCGEWGREILQTLALIPTAPVVAICDHYKSALNRAKKFAPNAEAVGDYQKVLEMKSVQAVIVATPTHLHREIVEAALKAGKHVYCEAPLGHTIEDARAIAAAAQAAVKVNFQAGLQSRSDPQKAYVLSFLRNGAAGKTVMARGQWHQNKSWRNASSDPDREKAINWRLDPSLSTGLAGEIGIHQLDVMNWFLNQRPESVTGYGGIMKWGDDGRKVPDTIQSILHYPGSEGSGKVNFSYDATLCNSFEDEYSVLYGTFAAVLIRQGKAWLFQEADSPLLGWEIYASKEQFGKETGISLAADASHSVKTAKDPAESKYADTALNYALKAFVYNSGRTEKDVAAFISSFGEDLDALREYLAQPTQLKARRGAANYREGLEATVCGIKMNEAVLKNETVALPEDLFKI